MKRLLLALGFVLAVCAAAQANPSITQVTNACGASSGTVSCTFGTGGPANGDTIAIGIDSTATSNGAPNNVHDSNSTNLTKSETQTQGPVQTTFIYDEQAGAGLTAVLSCVSAGSGSCIKGLGIDCLGCVYANATYSGGNSGTTPSLTFTTTANAAFLVNVQTGSTTETLSCTSGCSSSTATNSGTARPFIYGIASGTSVTITGNNSGALWGGSVGIYPAPATTTVNGCPPYPYPCLFQLAMRPAVPIITPIFFVPELWTVG